MRITIPVLALSLCQVASAISINWSTAQSSSNVVSPANAVGSPNGSAASINDPTGLLTVSQFLQQITYNDSALAAALNLPSLPVFNVILFEINGTAGFGWESAQFAFSSGGPAVNMQRNSGSAVGTPVNFIVASGAITPAAYQAFFGFNPAVPAGDVPYLLLDLTGSGVNVSSPLFQISINGINGGTPDPEAIGIIPSGVPEPGTAGLLFGGLALAILRRRRTRAGKQTQF